MIEKLEKKIKIITAVGGLLLLMFGGNSLWGWVSFIPEKINTANEIVEKERKRVEMDTLKVQITRAVVHEMKSILANKAKMSALAIEFDGFLGIPTRDVVPFLEDMVMWGDSIKRNTHKIQERANWVDKKMKMNPRGYCGSITPNDKGEPGSVLECDGDLKDIYFGIAQGSGWLKPKFYYRGDDDEIIPITILGRYKKQ